LYNNALRLSNQVIKLLFKLMLGTLCLYLAADSFAQSAADTRIKNPIPQIKLSNASVDDDLDQCLSPTTSAGEEKLRRCEAALSDNITPATRAQILTAMCKLSVARNDLTAARSYIEDALVIAPDAPSVLNNWGAVLIRQSSFAAATDAFSKALLGTQQSNQQLDLTAALYHNRSMALRAQGDYQEAAADYAEYLRVLNLAATSTTLQDRPALIDGLNR
jgi:tetratricopeptide (TPR) repeat protein